MSVATMIDKKYQVNEQKGLLRESFNESQVPSVISYISHQDCFLLPSSFAVRKRRGC